MITIYQNKLLYPEILWERPVHQYKAGAGKILVVAGSRGAQSTALLTCEAIFRCGTGILTLAFPEELKGVYSGILPEAMTLALPQTHSGSIARNAKQLILDQLGAVDLVLVGPGISTNTETVQLVWELLPRIEKTLVLDGDGLSALAYGIDAIRSKEGIEKVREYFNDLKAKLFITPTSGDASHILSAMGLEKAKCKASYIEKHKPESAQLLADGLGATVIINGPGTVAVSPKTVRPLQGSDPSKKEYRVVVSKVGNSGVYGRESESILSGILASFLAQNPSQKFKASCTAVYINSIAQIVAKEEIGERDISPNDIIRYLPQAIKKVENDQT